MSDLLTPVVNVLVQVAVLLAVARWYLALNKLWTRKHLAAVVGSLSTANLAISFVSIVLNMSEAAGTGNLAQAAANAVDVIGVGAIFVVSLGVFIPANRGVNPFTLLVRSFVMERAEATNLLRTFTAPKGAPQILDIMEKLAAADDEIAPEEIALIGEFTAAWGIDPPSLTPGPVAEPVPLEALTDSVARYLALEPPTEQATQLVDLIALLVESDGQVTDEETRALSEIRGAVTAYTAAHSHEPVTAFDVLIVAQSEAQREAVRELLPGATEAPHLGGRAFEAGRFYSQAYADAVAARYTALNLYATWEKVTA